MYTKEVIKKQDPSGVYLVDDNGELFWQPTPFYVTSLCDIGLVNANTTHTISEVGLTKHNEIVYIIGNFYYHYSYFSIQQ